MDISPFIVWGDSAVDVLRQRNRLLRQSNPIINVVEDLRMGPLEDADQVIPHQRIAWWNAVLRAQPWLPDEAAGQLLLNRYLDYRRQLLSALAAPQPVIAWVGNNVQDQLLLALIASLASPSTPLSVVDITEHVPHQWDGHCVVAICKPEALTPLVPRQLTDGERATLTAQWAYWKACGRGWRETDPSGQIVEYPLDHLDSLLLASMAAASGPQPASRLVGRIMGEYPGMVPDNFLFWRLHELRQAGRVVFMPGKDQDPQALQVALI